MTSKFRPITVNYKRSRETMSRLRRNLIEHKKILEGFARFRVVPDWYRGQSFFQLGAAEELLNALRDDGEQKTVHRIRSCIQRIGIRPCITDDQIRFILKLSRYNDIAFLWFLMELHYKTPENSYSCNEQIIMSTIAHLDMITTLRGLDKILPPPLKKKKKMFKKLDVPIEREFKTEFKKSLTKSSSVNKLKRYTSVTYNAILSKRYPKAYFAKIKIKKPYGQPLHCNHPNLRVRLRRYKAFYDSTYIPPNESNRWFAYYDSHRISHHQQHEEASNIFTNLESLSLKSNIVEDLCQKHHVIDSIQVAFENKLKNVAEQHFSTCYDITTKITEAKRKRILDQLEKDVEKYRIEFGNDADRIRKASAFKILFNDKIYYEDLSENIMSDDEEEVGVEEYDTDQEPHGDNFYETLNAKYQFKKKKKFCCCESQNDLDNNEDIYIFKKSSSSCDESKCGCGNPAAGDLKAQRLSGGHMRKSVSEIFYYAGLTNSTIKIEKPQKKIKKDNKKYLSTVLQRLKYTDERRNFLLNYRDNEPDRILKRRLSEGQALHVTIKDNVDKSVVDKSVVCPCKKCKCKLEEEKYFEAPTEHQLYKFNYRKIFNCKENTKENLSIRKSFIDAVNSDIRLLNKLSETKLSDAVDQSFKKLYDKSMNEKNKLFMKEKIRLERSKKNAINYSTDTYDPNDNELMDDMLIKALKFLAEDSKYVLASMPKAHRIPTLYEWVRERYGKRYTKKERYDEFAMSMKVMNSVRQVIFTAALPSMDQFEFWNCVSHMDYSWRDDMVKTCRAVRKKYYKQLNDNFMTNSRLLWLASRNYLCKGPSLISAFYAYMPSRVGDNLLFRPWKLSEHNNFVFHFNARQSKLNRNANAFSCIGKSL